jgi:hypothetical protein
MLDAFNKGVAASKVLDKKTDAGLIASGQVLANQIDYAIENLSGQEVTKALYLTPHLVNILREMKATPAARDVAAKASEAKSGGKLASVSNIPRPA